MNTTTYSTIPKHNTAYSTNSKNTTNFRLTPKVNTQFNDIDKYSTSFSNGSLYKLGIKLNDSIITLDSLTIYLQGFTTAISPNSDSNKITTSYKEI